MRWPWSKRRPRPPLEQHPDLMTGDAAYRTGKLILALALRLMEDGETIIVTYGELDRVGSRTLFIDPSPGGVSLRMGDAFE